ncbi:MAG: beta-ketoacyl-ACP synthase [Gammaproteobacteria bacterium]|nr:beta-ketoacyl-ACP synthase [Gammaproteobacteria bacterium]
MTNRVVVTGMGAVTSLGRDWETVSNCLKDGVSGVRYMTEWEDIQGLNTRLGAPIENFEVPPRFKRKQLRGMGRVAKLAITATDDALADAKLLDTEVLASGLTGVAYGSSTGSVDAVAEFGEVLLSRSTHSLNSTSYVRMMPHTTAVNISVVYKAKGRIIPTSCACASGSLAIGYAYEAIKHGYQTVMIAGGAEELDATEAAVFDTLYATSVRNDAPSMSPRPFDADRDGLVIGEGAGTLVLEEYHHAVARGARIYAEIVGFGTNSDGNHVTQPTQQTMEVAMNMALADATISPDSIDYVSAHAAATYASDEAESLATANVLGNNVSISSLKGYFGHSLGACGAIEAWLGIKGLQEGWFPANNNLDNIDPKCGWLDYIVAKPKHIDCQYFMSNNFAFGGMNTSLIFKRIRDE